MWILGIASIAIFVGSLLLIPFLVVRIKPDYFVQKKRPPAAWEKQPLFIRIAIVGLKNLLGLVLVAAGIAMFVLPGQGLLTLLAGIFLLDFPGKYKFEKWVVARSVVHRPINWIRRRRGKEPIEFKQRGHRAGG